MTQEEVKLRRLQGQYLLFPANTQSVVRDLCGIQAQYLSHSLHALSLRSASVETRDLIKGWTLRGTMHLICCEDLPLLLHQGRSPFLRPVDTLEDDHCTTARRKTYFSRYILDALSHGPQIRDDLKAICRAAGMTVEEEAGLFDPWGGIIRALWEEGQICHQVRQEKVYCLAPAFSPMSYTDARLELARRYFTHYGPASIKDAAYFFGCPQREIKFWLDQLPVQSDTVGRHTLFHIPAQTSEIAMPEVLFLAGFDPLMLGYDKHTNPFLPEGTSVQIFTRSGIVRPVLLVNGIAQGWWSLKGTKLTVTLFAPVAEERIHAAVALLWPQVKTIVFE